jgi:hypothetical protein
MATQDDNNNEDLFPDDTQDEFAQKAESLKYINKLEKRMRLAREKQFTIEEQNRSNTFSGKDTYVREEEEDVKESESLIENEDDENVEQEQSDDKIESDDSVQNEDEDAVAAPPRGIMKRYYDIDSGELDSDFVNKKNEDDNIDEEKIISDDENEDDEEEELEELDHNYSALALEDDEDHDGMNEEHEDGNEEEEYNKGQSEDQGVSENQEFEVDFDAQFSDN